MPCCLVSFAGKFYTIEVSSFRWRVAQAAEIRWWKRYLKRRDPSAYLTWKKAYWSKFLNRINAWPADGDNVLDAGCGPAGVFTVLAKAQVTAIDPLLEQYNALPHFDRKAYAYVKWIAGKLEEQGFEEAFDSIFCLNVINHVQDLSGSVQVLAKALKPQGRLVVSVDAHRHPWLKPLFKLVPGDVLHPHQLDLEEYIAIFQAHGLTVDTKLLYAKEFLFDYWVLTLSHAKQNG